MQERALLPALGLVLVAACGGEVFVSGTGGAGGAGGQGAAGATGGTGPGGSGGGGGIDFTACSGPGQCALRSVSCCGQCGAATPGDMIGVHHDFLDDYAAAYCANVACPGCFMPQDPNLFSYCEAGHCVAADVRALELAACNSAADCTLRWGLECCEGCGLAPAEGLVAVNANAVGMLSALVCAPDWGCPDCLVQYPPGAMATCSAGRCEVVFVTPGG
ncbi:MAG: hypothetical protein IT373_12950 [Polyangiaceae bacterium]|nr:hypothetical protein [Polyangiaceae bacterium]